MVALISTGKGTRANGVEFLESESNAEVLVSMGYATLKVEEPIEKEEVINHSQRGRKPKQK